MKVYYEADAIAAPGPNVAIERGNLWAESDLLAWRPQEQGETLELSFPTETEGKYRLHLALELCSTAGQISAILDDQPIRLGGKTGPLDLHVADRCLARQFVTDKVELAAGEHRLQVRFDGAQDSIKEPRIGIDYLAAQKQ